MQLSSGFVSGTTATPIAETQFPHTLSEWLHLDDSMTAAIARQYGQEPQVQVHYSGRDELADWETQCLGSPPGAVGYARHISLNIHHRPVLLARSVALHGGAIEPLLSQLQQTPLARVLFEDDQWQRVDTPLPLQVGPRLFGRACVWLDQRSGERLLVEEFFNFKSGRA